MRRYIAAALIVVAMSIDASADTAGTVRQPVDTVGYATVPAQVERVVAISDSLMAEGLFPWALLPDPSGLGGMIGAIAPHDDYIYAGPFYTMTFERLGADLVVLFGVAHRARRIGLEGKLIFEDFSGWKGPYGVTQVSPLREKVIGRLPAELVLVDGAFHATEHSLEAFIPFLQYYRGMDVEILPVLVTRFSGESLPRAASEMSRALADVFSENSLQLGADVAIMISADCVHYGDDQWGGSNYAPFGADEEGFIQGRKQDGQIAMTTLEGPVSEEKIAWFRRDVERDDLENPYKVTWCGVYSIPFGLTVLEKLAAEMEYGIPNGRLLGYGTSLDPGPLPVEEVGLGATNIATLRHWVGYLAMGYW